MCDTCGCGEGAEVTIRRPGQETENRHAHGHGHHHHSHEHPHEHPHDQGRRVAVEEDVLGKNNLLAERNRGYLEALGVFSVNMVSSPGSGKTTLLERTIADLKEQRQFFIIEGDQQSMNDAERIDRTGVPVVQVNTGSGCHLDAEMVLRAIKELSPVQGSVLLIENVGNLVCPALFDLGETERVVIMSITEGEDKPVKYPDMFRTSGLCIINKTDLLPHLDFNMEQARSYARQVNPDIRIIECSAKTGEGMEDWYAWLSDHLA